MSKTAWLLEASGPVYFTGEMKMTGHPKTTDDANKAKHYESKEDADTDRLSQHTLTLAFRSREHTFEGVMRDAEDAPAESKAVTTDGEDGGKHSKGNKAKR